KGSELPPAPVMDVGAVAPVKAATGAMSPANSTRCKAPARHPTPPSVPDTGSTLVEKAGTSPLAPGVVWVANAPAAPLSVVFALALPLKPAPVAIWYSASIVDSGLSPP